MLTRPRFIDVSGKKRKGSKGLEGLEMKSWILYLEISPTRETFERICLLVGLYPKKRQKWVLTQTDPGVKAFNVYFSRAF